MATETKAIVANQATGPEATRVDVLAFAQDRETREFLQNYLQATSGASFHVAKGGVDAAVRFLEEAQHPPRLLLVDISGAETPLSEIDRLADVCEASIVVVALGELENVHLFRELIRAGIVDYITKPLSADLLAPYVRDRRDRIAPAGGAARRGKVVVFTGARGGVGTTTLAVSVAWSLANVQRRRVALIDLDIHAGVASIQLGLQPGGLTEALENYRRLDALFLERTLAHHGPRLSVLSDEAPLRRDAPVNPEALDALITTLADDFHYLIVDLPRHFGALHAHVMEQARERMIVADRTLPAIRDAARLLEGARESLNPAHVILNDHHPGLRKLIPDSAIEKALGQAADVEVEYDKGAANAGDNLGDPLAARRGPIATATREIVDTLSGRRVARRSRWARFGSARK